MTAQAAQCAVLEFEGVYHNAEVHLNGEKIASCPYGYSDFYADLTGKLLPGRENVLEVIAHNADQPNSPLVFRRRESTARHPVGLPRTATSCQWCAGPHAEH